jgi:hypothetical protein
VIQSRETRVLRTFTVTEAKSEIDEMSRRHFCDNIKRYTYLGFEVMKLKAIGMLFLFSVGRLFIS